MALAGWTKKSQITIAANKLSKTVTNQVIPLSFKAGHFPAAMVTTGNSNACKADGGDIRFSSDEAGDNLLAFDVMSISQNTNSANANLIVFVRTNVTANASFSIWCHWGNSSAEKPASSSTIGAGSCWGNAYGVLYMQENPANYTTTEQKWKALKEATGRFSGGSLIGSPTQVAGPIAGMYGVSINDANGIQIPEVTNTSRGGFQIAMFVKAASSPISGAIYHKGASSQMIGFNGGKFKWQYGETWGNTNFGTGTTWKLLTATLSGSNVTATFGDADSTTVLNSATALSDLQYIGGADTGDSVKNLSGSVCLMIINQFTALGLSFFSNLEDGFNNIATLASPGTIQAVSSSSALTVSGAETGSYIQIMDSSSGNILAYTASSSGDFSYPYSGTPTVDISVIKPGFVPVYYDNLTLASGGQSIPIQAVTDLWYDGDHGNLTSGNVTINASTNTITVSVVYSLRDLYNYLIDAWPANTGAMKYKFALTALTDQQMIMEHPWVFEANTDSVNLRKAGYRRVNASGAVLESWMGVETLGSLPSGAYVHFIQTANGTSTWPQDFIQVSGSSAAKAIQIYGDVNNGNFTKNTAFKMFFREWGYTFADYDLTVEQDISALTYRLYQLPLSSIVDTKLTTTVIADVEAAPYTNIQLTYHSTPVQKTVDGTAYDFNVVIDGAGLTLAQIYTRVRYLQHRSRYQNMYNTGAGVSGSGRTEPSLHVNYLGDRLITEPGVFIENFLATEINNVTFKDTAGTSVSYPTIVSFVLTDLQPNTEVRLLKASDLSEIAGVENSGTSFSYQYTYSSDIAAIAIIHNLQYQPIRLEITLGAQNQSLPIQQQVDRWYENPS